MDKFKRLAESAIGSDVGAEAATDSSSLRSSALQCNYQGDSIANVITRLLQVYRPQDDIVAYERVLKKLQGLLTNCDSPRKRLLLSMVPAPKNVPDHKIAEVFGAITGFVRPNSQGNGASQSPVEIMGKSAPRSQQHSPYDQDASGLKSSFSEGCPFRGFAENEISTTIRNHVKNVKHMYGVVECDPSRSEISLDVSSNPPSRADRQANSSNRPPNDNPQNRSDGSECQTSICRQYLLNKQYRAPAGCTASELQSCYSSRTTYQETTPVKTCDNTEIILDLSQDKAPRLLNDVKYGCNKKCDDTDKEAGESKVAIDVDRKSAQTIETIKDSVRKMDDVCWEDEDRSIFVDADDILATVRDELKTSLNNFLKRAQEGTSVELPAFPRIRSYPRPYFSDFVYSTSIDQKPATARKVLGKDSTPSNNDKDLLSKWQKAGDNLGKNRPEEKAKQEPFARVVNGLQTKRDSRELGKTSGLSLLQNNLDHITEKKTVAAQRKETSAKKESIYGCKMIRLRSSEISAENNFQVHSMSELAEYKKQYYDTLLSVQRAKVAVTNSLASSSSSCSSSLSLDRLMVYDDLYYSNYTCQQQHLFEQQRHFPAIRPQFSPTCPTALSGLTNLQQHQHQQHGNQQYSWARSDCKYLLLKQLRLRQQASSPGVYATRDQSGWIHRYVGPMYSCRPFASDRSGQTEQCVRRKSLEDIVGKLKGVERGSVND